jgi:hypothetical protein
MEQLTSIKEQRFGFSPATHAPAPRRRRPHAPLYASPWVALFVIVRRGLRQTRVFSS